MRSALAIAASLALLFQGVASACEPVLCRMTGIVAAGRCSCDHPDAEAGIAARCCERSAVDAAPTLAAATATLFPPALPVLRADAPVPCTAPTPAEARPDARAPSPPIPILHRALLR